MARKRKIKRSGQAAVLQLNKSKGAISSGQIQTKYDDHDDKVADSASCFVTVKITRDANIQEMGRLFKAGVKSIASVSSDLNILKIKTLKVPSNRNATAKTVPSVASDSTSTKETVSDKDRKLPDPLSKCAPETSNSTSRTKECRKVSSKKSNKLKDKSKEKRKKLSLGHHACCKTGNIVLKLSKGKRKKQKKILGTLQYVKEEIQSQEHLTDFEKALCSPDTVIKARKGKSKLKPRVNNTKKNCQSALVSAADIEKDIEQCVPGVYIDVAANPEDSLYSQCSQAPDNGVTDHERLTGFNTIEDFEFPKATAITEETLNRKEYFQNSRLPDGYLTLKVNTCYDQVYSFDLDHYGKNLFRVPVKDELVGTPLGKKRKVHQPSDIVKCKVSKKILSHTRQSSIQHQFNTSDTTETLQPEPAASPKSQVNETDSADDNWDLDEYDLKPPSVEVINVPVTETGAQMNDIIEPITIDLDEHVEPGKSYTKQLNLKKDSSNISVPEKDVHETVPAATSPSSGIYSNNMSNIQVSYAVLNNNKEYGTISQMQEHCIPQLDQQGINQTSPIEVNTTIPSDFKVLTSFSEASNSVHHLSKGGDVISFQSVPSLPMPTGISETLIKTSEKTLLTTSTSTVVSDTIPVPVHSPTGLSRDREGIQPQYTVSVASTVIGPLSMVTVASKPSMPAPLMALAEIATTELSTEAVGKANSEEEHRQALAKILPSPIVSPVAKEGKENARKHTPSSSPTCPTVKVQNKPNSLRFTLDENGEVSNPGTGGIASNNQPKKDMPKGTTDPLAAMYYSAEGVTEKKRKKKYAFAKNVVDKLSSEISQQSIPNTTNNGYKFCEGVQSNDIKHVVSSPDNAELKQTQVQTKPSYKDTGVQNKTAESAALATPLRQSPVTDFKSPLLSHPATIPFLSPRNQQLMQEVEKLKNEGRSSLNNIPHGSLFPYQPLCLPAFPRYPAPVRHVGPAIRGLQQPQVSTLAGPNVHSQVHEFIPSVTAMARTSTPQAIQSRTQNITLSTPNGSCTVSNFDSKEKQFSPSGFAIGSCSGTTATSYPDHSSYAGPIGSCGKVLPKVSAKNLMIYKQQLADRQTTASAAETIAVQLDADNTVAVKSTSPEVKDPVVPQTTITSSPPDHNFQELIGTASTPVRYNVNNVEHQSIVSNIASLDQSLTNDITSETLEMKSGLDLLSAAANLPDIVKMDESSTETHVTTEGYHSFSLSHTLKQDKTSGSSIVQKVSELPQESFALPHTPPDSVNDHDDVSNSTNPSGADGVEHLAFANFSTAELFEELLKRQSLTKCICGCSFLDSTLYMLHRASHNTDQPHMCAYCGKVGRSWMDFYAHMCDHSK